MSTIGAVLDALSALSQTTAPTAQVIIGSGASITVSKPLLIAVADQPVTGRSELDSLSLSTHTEQYTVPMLVSDSLAGPGTQDAAIDGAMDVYTALEQAIRLDPTLGLGEGVSALPTGDFSMTPTADAMGRQAAVRFSVAVFAQTS